MRTPARPVAGLLLAAALLGAAAPGAGAHAALLSSRPAARTSPATSPPRVILRFSEPVEVLRAADVAVVDSRGRSVTAAPPRTDPADARRVILTLRPRLEPDSYTARWRVLSDDAHAGEGALVFGVAGARLKPPVLRALGPVSDRGAWAVGARFAELSALGLLLALIAFRALVWAPVLAGARGLEPRERRAAEVLGRRWFWRAFWATLVVAGLAEAGVLVARTAIAYGTGVRAAAADPASAYRLVSGSRFGDLFGWRGAILCALAAVSFAAWSRERTSLTGGRDARNAPAAALALVALVLISAQGHASQAPAPALSVAFDAVHLGAAACWIGGLPCLAAALAGLPRALPAGGRRLAAGVAQRFSRLAAVAVAVLLASGLLRLAGELAVPAQLWSSAYGRTVLVKLALLLPVAGIALYNRRALARMARGVLPRGRAVAVLRRAVTAELVVGLAIVLAAAVLVAQIPGRS